LIEVAIGWMLERARRGKFESPGVWPVKELVRKTADEASYLLSHF
jgi:hypothetical protein